MPKIRWYHYYFTLALFDVIVIMLSLHLHNQTLERVKAMIEEAGSLQKQSGWLQRTQQRIIQLNAPGNDLFSARTSEDYQIQQRRFDQAKTNMAAQLQSVEQRQLNIQILEQQINKMIQAAETIFKDFSAMSRGPLNQQDYESVLHSAGPKMAEMDRQQHQALSALGLLFARNAHARNHLLDTYQKDLRRRLDYERYFIAAVILILVGVLAFGRKLQQAERALVQERQRAKEERRERLAAIGELCSSVAHGIRNPLAAIRSSAQLTLELGRTDDDSQQRLRDIMHEGERLGDRVTGLLSMARTNAEAFELVELNSIVQMAVRELRPELDRMGLHIEQVIDAKPITIHGDRRQLEQIIIELLSNAMDHSHKGDTVHLELHRDAGNAVLVVADRGPGIPNAVRDRIFDLFFTTRPEGTGIGLATVKRIARLHGGDVVLTSPDKGGARFEVTFPIAKSGRNGKTQDWTGTRHA
ncbi:MAG: PAS domain-containing sensor histidine kinase [Phycisphaerae bacterium]